MPSCRTVSIFMTILPHRFTLHWHQNTSPCSVSVSINCVQSIWLGVYGVSYDNDNYDNICVSSLYKTFVGWPNNSESPCVCFATCKNHCDRCQKKLLHFNEADNDFPMESATIDVASRYRNTIWEQMHFILLYKYICILITFPLL